MFNPETIKNDFPIFKHQPDLVYLDSAATAQKPRTVIQAVTDYYEQYTSNIARGIYPLAEEATEKFETARARVANFIGATRPEEIIFTAGTTASLNLVASLLAPRLDPDSSVVVSMAEHHSNYLPWKELATQRQAHFSLVPVTPAGFIDAAALAEAVTPNTKIVALSAISNVLGVINPIRELVQKIRTKNPTALVVIDAAQAIGHIPIAAAEWDADFLAFSGHKMFGPTGIGVLYGRYQILEHCPPITFGGGMVLDACADKPLYKEIPYRFEAGTPHIAGVIGLAAAIDFVTAVGLEAIQTHEQILIRYALEKLQTTFGDDLHIVGTTDPSKKSSILSFTLVGIHPHDVASLLGEHQVCVRAGLQCAAPLHESLQLPATTRVSLALYNTKADIDALIKGLQAVRTVVL